MGSRFAIGFYAIRVLGGSNATPLIPLSSGGNFENLFPEVK
jgi:hypothetical protein